MVVIGANRGLNPFNKSKLLTNEGRPPVDPFRFRPASRFARLSTSMEQDRRPTVSSLNRLKQQRALGLSDSVAFRNQQAMLKTAMLQREKMKQIQSQDLARKSQSLFSDISDYFSTLAKERKDLKVPEDVRTRDQTRSINTPVQAI